MESNGMEWDGTQRNGMEWNGVERNGMEWNGVEWCPWNGIEGNRLLEFDARSSQIGAPGPPKSVPEAPGGTQNRF